MPDRSGFADAPVTRALLFYLVAASLVVALADVKDLVDLRVRSGGAGTGAGAGADAGAYDGHGGHGGHGNEEAEDMLMSWGWWVLERVWRLGVWQLACTNSTELLFATITLYRLRVIERLWGSKKFASFILITLPLTSILTPLLLTLLSYPLSIIPLPFLLSLLAPSPSHHSESQDYTHNDISPNYYNHHHNSSNYYYYIPAGPTPILFALLAQFSNAVPALYRWRVGLGLGPGLEPDGRLESTRSADSSADSNVDNTDNVATIQSRTFNDHSITLTSKSLSYVPALQLAFCALPGSLVGAVTGWVVGMAYREGVLPGGVVGWRLGRGFGRGL